MEAPERKLGGPRRDGGYVPGRERRDIYRLLDMEEWKEDTASEGGYLPQVSTESAYKFRTREFEFANFGTQTNEIIDAAILRASYPYIA